MKENSPGSTGEHARGDSPESDPEMPTLVLVEYSPERTGGQAPDLGEMTLWRVDGVLYEIPFHVRTVIESACDETAKGLNRMQKASRSRFRWCNQFLNAKHKFHIHAIDEDMDTGKVIIRIAEDPGEFRGHRRLCRFDGKRYSLGQVLQWALNVMGASYNWTLLFWQREFVL